MIEPRRHVQRCLARLEEDLRQCAPARLASGGVGWLLAIAAISGLSGLLLYSLGGYHIGFQLFNDWSRSVPAWLWENITFMGDALFVMCLLLLIARRHPQLVWAGLLGALLGIAYTHVLKELFNTARPLGVLEAGSFQLIGPGHRKGSFPSGHAMSIFLFACIVIYYLRSTWQRLLILAIAILVGLSRVAVGVHWPLDVAAGAFGGALSALGGIALSVRFRWGLQLRGYLVLVLILVLAAVLLIGHRGGYPRVALLSMITSLVALAVFVREYLFNSQPP